METNAGMYDAMENLWFKKRIGLDKKQFIENIKNDIRCLNELLEKAGAEEKEEIEGLITLNTLLVMSLENA